MIVHRDINLFTAKNPIITVGTFDGVHLGHRTIINQMKEIAQRNIGETVVFTFFPHPRLVVSPNETNLRLLTTIEEKIELLEDAGIDHLIVFPFDNHFSKLTYHEFIESIIINKLHANTLVVGYDHRIGKNREGSFDKLQKLSKKLNFNLQKIDAFSIYNTKISSTKIRMALQNGNIQKANEYLGKNFILRGKVSLGNQIGRSIGFPTANIISNDPMKLIPAQGVYATKVRIDQTYYYGMLNIGYRPTVNKNADQRTIEVHILDFNENIYDKNISLYLDKRIRSEMKFTNLDGLKKQLKADEEKVRKFYQQ